MYHCQPVLPTGGNRHQQTDHRQRNARKELTQRKASTSACSRTAPPRRVPCTPSKPHRRPNRLPKRVAPTQGPLPDESERRLAYTASTTATQIDIGGLKTARRRTAIVGSCPGVEGPRLTTRRYPKAEARRFCRAPIVTGLAILTLLSAATQPARAHSDPASDVLLSQQLFLPVSTTL